MDSASTSKAALELEIARLTGAINRHKSGSSTPSTGSQRTFSRNNTYVNPDYKPAIQAPRRTVISNDPLPQAIKPPLSTTERKEVVLGGVAFESSGRSLVRKDHPNAASVSKPVVPRPLHSRAEYSRSKAGHLIPINRPYKPKTSSRGRRGRPANRNMTLHNTRRPYQNRSKRKQYSDKPCPRFTRTGECSRGQTCTYQHDPAKIAICWNYLKGECANTAETCNLSHDPTPERTPLCKHFANQGRCTRDNCQYPHVKVSARQGVCRDFAVLGYCSKGIDCDRRHVRECPDFGETGSCPHKDRCKMPHVIRRQPIPKAASTPTLVNPMLPLTGGPTATLSNLTSDSGPSIGSDIDSTSSLRAYAEDAHLGDEYISLTFHESESSEDDSDGDEESEDDEEEGGENIEVEISGSD